MTKAGSDPVFDPEIRYCILGSGSKANSYYFEAKDFAFIIDNGFPLGQWTKRAKQANLSLEKIKFIFLTHSHGDHLRGVADLSRHLNVPVVVHNDTPESTTKGFSQHLTVESGKTYAFGPLSFYTFDLHHDSPGSVSYYFQLSKTKFTLLTDTGHLDEKMMRLAAKSHYLFLESNYCINLLETGPYPAYLKRRIHGKKGHLSNNQAKDLIAFLTTQDSIALRKIYLVHLSQTNNHVSKVAQQLEEIPCHDFDILICPKNAMVTMKDEFFFHNQDENGKILKQSTGDSKCLEK